VIAGIAAVLALGGVVLGLHLAGNTGESSTSAQIAKITDELHKFWCKIFIAYDTGPGGVQLRIKIENAVKGFRAPLSELSSTAWPPHVSRDARLLGVEVVQTKSAALNALRSEAATSRFERINIAFRSYVDHARTDAGLSGFSSARWVRACFFP